VFDSTVISSTMMNPELGNKSAVHKQGYLFKQGTYFSAWNERYFSLESSLLKQFQDVDSAMPSYSIYLGYAAVDGVFSAQMNEEAGYGAIWSFVIRWPLPMSPDAIEEQWGFMHIGSYDEKEIDEWFDSICALIKVEQTRRLLGEMGNRAIGTNTPPDFLPIPTGRSRTILHVSPHIKTSLPRAWIPVYENFVSNFNIPAGRWNLESTHDGMLYRNRDNDRLWKFILLVPRDDGVLVSSVTAKRVWEAILGEAAGTWEPSVKHASYVLRDTEVITANEGSSNTIFLDKADFNCAVRRWIVSADFSLHVDRLAFKDDRSGMYVVLGHSRKQAVVNGDTDLSSKLFIESMCWGVETILEHKSLITVIFEFQRVQDPTNKIVRFLYNFFPSIIADAIASHPRRIKEFILSQ